MVEGDEEPRMEMMSEWRVFECAELVTYVVMGV